MDEKKNVLKFRKKYNLKKVDVVGLIKTIESQGYTVVPFNLACSNDNVRLLIKALKLEDYVFSCKCFTYCDDKYRLVFVNEDLSEDEKIVVLAHEEGHIWHEHMISGAVFGADVKQEFQANEFAHFLLEDKDGTKRKNRIVICTIIILIFIISGLYIFYQKKYDERVYTDNYYRTNSGLKYHLEECVYIKNRKDVYKLTREEFESGNYEPCAVCIPFED